MCQALQRHAAEYLAITVIQQPMRKIMPGRGDFAITTMFLTLAIFLAGAIFVTICSWWRGR